MIVEDGEIFSGGVRGFGQVFDGELVFFLSFFLDFIDDVELGMGGVFVV